VWYGRPTRIAFLAVLIDAADSGSAEGALVSRTGAGPKLTALPMAVRAHVRRLVK